MSKNYVQNLSDNYPDRRKQLMPACHVPSIPNQSSIVTTLTDPMSPSKLIKKAASNTCKGEVFLLRIWHKINLQKSISSDTKQHKTANKTQAHNTNKTTKTAAHTHTERTHHTNQRRKTGPFLHTKGSFYYYSRSRNLWWLPAIFESRIGKRE